MAKKPRSLAPPPSPTDEWGIYDPSKAGMEALYSRLGRPVPRAGGDDDGERRRRKRVFRASRPAEGVGMALREARRRADEMSDAQRVPPFVPAAAIPAIPVPPPPEPDVPVAVAVVPVKPARAKAAKPARRKAAAPVVEAASGVVELPPPAVAPPASEAVESPVPKRGRKAARAKAVPRTATPVAMPTPAAQAVPAVPPPSPRRPRGPVPLAAWAHAVSDTERPEPKRHESKGLWRGIFRIPSEVALVEYGRGCRIHRLVIEGAADQAADPF